MMKMSDLIVTTSPNPPQLLLSLGQSLAAEIGGVFLARQGRSLNEITEMTAATAVVTVTRQGVTVWSEHGQFSFHPGMAKLRILACRQGKSDKMGRAMALQPGDSVLDCTLGLGSDAVVASYLAGPTGAVCGLESETVIAAVVRRGLGAYSFPELPELEAAMRRITVVNTDHLTYLSALPAGSFDIVYFDPMFREPVRKSPGMNSLRWLTNDRAITREAVEQAVRVARRRVVMKERTGSPEFARLGFHAFVGAKGSRVVYGYLKV